jgi:hypothetical protein
MCPATLEVTHYYSAIAQLMSTLAAAQNPSLIGERGEFAGQHRGRNGNDLEPRGSCDPVGDTVGLPTEGLRIHVAGMGHSALFYAD